jgi:peptidyl-prolyl cis-trans isomerase B (cyclophilin B)
VASSKTRQRKLARAKIERQMARRAAKVRRQRRLGAGIVVGLVVLLGIAAAVWELDPFSTKKPPEQVATCVWTASTDKTNLTDVGLPPKTGEPRTGTRGMTITLDRGTVAATLDLAKAPCSAASFNYLAGKKFFDNTTCHRLTTETLFALLCGDPKGTGTGGPAYTFADENLPEAPSADPSASASASASPSASPSASAASVVYPRGTVAMFNNGSNVNGSQFMILYKDSKLSPTYSRIGTISQGLDVIDKIAAEGAVNDKGEPAKDGKPKNPVNIKSLTVTPPGQSSGSPSPGATSSPSSSGSATPSAGT